MNKGIIIEVRKDFSIVLSDGEFIRLVNKKEMKVGMTILFTKEDVIRRTYRYNMLQAARKYGSVAAAFVAVMFMTLMFYNNNYAVYSVVTMDINPSVEVFLNRDDEVLRLKAINEDGLVFEDLEIKGLELEAAIEALVEEAELEGYIDSEGYETATIVFTAVPMRGGKKDATAIVNKIEAVILDAEGYEALNIAVTDSSKEKLKEAEETETPLPLIELEVNLDEIETIKALFEEEDIVAELKVNGKLKTNNGNAFGKVKNEEDVAISETEEAEEMDEADDSSKGNEEKQGPSYGDSMETRNDLNEIILKLEWLLDPENYTPSDEDGDVVGRAEAYILEVRKALDSEDEFDFNYWKDRGQTLIKALRSEGVKISAGDSEEEREREQEENHGGNYDEDKDYDHDREQDRDSHEDAEEIAEELEDLKELYLKLESVEVKSDDGERIFTELAAAIKDLEAHVEGDDVTSYKDLKEEAKDYIRDLKDDGIKVSDDEEDEDEDDDDEKGDNGKKYGRKDEEDEDDED